MRWSVWLGGALAVLVLVTGTAVWLTRARPAVIVDELAARSTGDLVRYGKRRLEHHGKLETLFLPVLDWLQRQVERPVDLTTIPALGKGQTAAAGLAGVGTDGRSVQTESELRDAMDNATAGQTIVIAPGSYTLGQWLRTGHPGTAAQPITLGPAVAGSVTLRVADTMGVRVTQPYWVFEGLRWRGVCAAHDDCEHALQVVGAARGVLIRNNHMEDFNAHIKVNGEGGIWPDDGRIEHNTLVNSVPRRTTRSVTPIDIVAASGWRVSDNLIANFVKADGNGVSFGAYMKGAGTDGRFERNLVVCTPRDISQPGVRVGLSAGGGGTDPAVCRDRQCIYEHRGAVFVDNIIAHCNDAGIDVNHGTQTLVLHNTLINTAGVLVRGDPSSADVRHNLFDGGVRRRPESQVDARNNVAGDSRRWFADADRLDLAWREQPAAPEEPSSEDATMAAVDFCGQPRPAGSPPGALVSAAGCR
jgi:hypothetical protein